MDNEERRLKLQNRKVFNIEWFTYSQITSCFKYDKQKHGFTEEKSKWETVLLEGKEKLISKIYRILLEWFTEQEVINIQMVKWSVNFQHEIPLSNWEYLWKKSIKLSTSMRIKENRMKMQYR